MKYRYISSIFIIVSILLITIITIITPDKEVSLLEGRSLEIIPIPEFIRNKFSSNDKVNNDIEDNEISSKKESNDNVVLLSSASDNKNDETESAAQVYIKQILNGEYFERWDTYFSDHIVGRDYIVSSYMKIQEAKNSQYINGVYIGKNEMLFSADTLDYNDEDIKERATKFNDFANKINSKDIYIGVVPNKYMIEKKYFTISDNDISQDIIVDKFEEAINKDKINLINFNNLKSKNNLFYKTDHHLNSEGSYLAYKDIVESINNKFEIGEPLDKSMFKVDTFEKCYIGADGRKVGYLVKNLEDITVYSPKDINYKAFDDGVEYNLIDTSQISQERFNNDYLVFMGGDKSRVVIENEDSKNNLNILIIGDSSDNPIIPMLIPHFSNIYSFDLRYNNINIINEINSIEPDIVLLLGLPFGYLDDNSKIFRFN